MLNPSALLRLRLLRPGVLLCKRVVRKAVRWYVEPRFADVETRFAGVASRLDDLETRLASLVDVVTPLKAEVALLHHRLAQLEQTRAEAQAAGLEQMVELEREVEELCSGLAVQRHGACLPSREAEAPPSAEWDDSDRFHAALAEQFRGSRQEIKDRLSVYLPVLEQADLGTPDMPILDLGCGRGEWLELLRDSDRHARGVDRNRIFVEQCRQLGLPVEEADLFAYLRTLADESVGAVSAFHVVEHLELSQLLRLLDEGLRVLKPGGLLLFETPNPENLVVASCNFYADPTHRQPLYPATLQLLAASRGFVRPDVQRVNQEVLERQFAGEPPPAQWARLFDYVRHHFLAAPDYALTAWKGGGSATARYRRWAQGAGEPRTTVSV